MMKRWDHALVMEWFTRAVTGAFLTVGLPWTGWVFTSDGESTLSMDLGVLLTIGAGFFLAARRGYLARSEWRGAAAGLLTLTAVSVLIACAVLTADTASGTHNPGFAIYMAVTAASATIMLPKERSPRNDA